MKSSERTLILGTGRLARALIAEISRMPRHDFGRIAVVAEGNRPVPGIECPVVGTLTNLSDVVMVFRPELIIVALPESTEASSGGLFDTSICRNIRVEKAEDVYESLTGKLAIEALTPGTIMMLGHSGRGALDLLASRGLSFVLAAIGIFVLGPLLLLIAAAIKLDSKGSALFVQRRVGLRGEPFKLLKFRTMRPVEGAHSEWVKDNEDRITRVGKWLRKFRLDELPQFVNVLRGDMNLVGPRPHPSSNFELFVLVSRNTPECGDQIPYYLLRSRARPGITGWAQVRYKYANDVDEEMEKLRFDLYYVKHASFFMDVRILVETVLVVLMGDGNATQEESPDEHPSLVER